MTGTPYIRLFGDDWLAGTNEMSLDERGALITIVAITASTGSAPRYDLERLSRRFGCTKGAAKKVLSSLSELGKISVVDGLVINGRALKETEISQKNSQKQSENAKLRWAKSDEKVNKNNGGAYATAMPRQCQPEPEPEPYIDDDDSASEVLTDRELMLVAMGHPQSGLTATGQIIGSPVDVMMLNSWQSDLGLSMAEIETVVQGIAKKRKGKPPPTSFKYYETPMREFAGAKNKPKLTPIDGGSTYAKPTSKSGQRVSAFISGARGTP